MPSQMSVIVTFSIEFRSLEVKMTVKNVGLDSKNWGRKCALNVSNFHVNTRFQLAAIHSFIQNAQIEWMPI